MQVNTYKFIYVIYTYAYMNTDATYRTRRQRVQGAVNGFIWTPGSQEKITFQKEP